MARELIDKKKFYDKVAFRADLCDPCRDEMINLLDDQSTVDAVEVVRCKDCKKGYPELAPNGGVWCAKWNHIFCDDGFCSYGERRTNERKAD